MLSEEVTDNMESGLPLPAISIALFIKDIVAYFSYPYLTLTDHKLGSFTGGSCAGLRPMIIS